MWSTKIRNIKIKRFEIELNRNFHYFSIYVLFHFGNSLICHKKKLQEIWYGNYYKFSDYNTGVNLWLNSAIWSYTSFYQSNYCLTFLWERTVCLPLPYLSRNSSAVISDQNLWQTKWFNFETINPLPFKCFWTSHLIRILKF